MKSLIDLFQRKKPVLSSYEMAKAEGYPGYLETASKLNIDVNDYLDNNLGWVKPLPVLEEIVFPEIEKFPVGNFIELGPGTGRWSRYILDKLTDLKYKNFFLIDHSQWIIDFLNEYFRENQIIKPRIINGKSITGIDKSIDVIFSQGVFIELKPSLIYLYSKEFAKLMNTGGYCIFDYFNADNDEGWEFFTNESDKGNVYFTFYSDSFIDKIFKLAGFIPENRFTFGKAKFVVFKKV